MEFEFDQRKSDSNKERHGIDFDDARILWEDADRLEIPAKTDDEPRYMIIGKIKGKVWSAVITYREHKIRIFSVRWSHESEVELYES